MVPIRSVLVLAVVNAVITCALPTSARAVPIMIGPWNEFSFTAVGVQARGCAPPDSLGLRCSPTGINSVLIGPPSWTLTNSDPVILRVTDGFTSGDAFQVFDFGTAILTTPIVATGSTCENVPDFCFASPVISHGQVTLAPGSHSITITPIEVNTPGAAFFQVMVPEPGTLVLVGLALPAIMAQFRSRYRSRQELRRKAAS